MKPDKQIVPLMRIIAAKAVALGVAYLGPFHARRRRTITNAKALAEGLIEGGVSVPSGCTDVAAQSWSTSARAAST